MVAVPYSKGCRTCIQRRVKCDETRPNCRRCELRGIQCPGYRKPLTFVVSTPSDSRTTAGPTYRSATRSAQSQKSNTSRSITKRGGYSHNTVDELIVPSLVEKPLAAQGVETLGFFIDATVPGLYYMYSTRLSVNWMNFARRHVESTLDPFIWSLRCLGTLHLGMKHQDQDTIASSRSMYSRGLQGLHSLLRRPRFVRSDMTLAIAVMLGIYEMMDPITPQSWLTHSSGIATLIRLRGPNVHRGGFGRTLLISFKSFIVADALIRGEACFLAEPAWQLALTDTLAAESGNGKGSQLCDLVELIFAEITKCPGLYARACAIIKNNETDHSMFERLRQEATRSKRRLQYLKDQLESVVPVSLDSEALRDKPDLIGLIPVSVAQKSRTFAGHGAQSALALLDQVIVITESDHHRLFTDSTMTTLPVWDVLPAPANCVTMDKEETLANRLPAWPDQLALSMGMLAVKDN
ncbi:C6 zinc finger domain protein [Aspergillus flavus]|nr:C6 zinc finger domain protein [Aspergillus flavus]RAQ81506.1 C6 zinc finger domain protein [Aspergillus flavus]